MSPCVATSYSSMPQLVSLTWKARMVSPGGSRRRLGDADLDDEAAAGLEVRRDVAEARDLRRLRRQVHDRVEDQVRDGERPVDRRRREVADRDADVLAARLRAQPRDHRLRQLDPVHRHAALRERERDPARPDPELERASAPGELGEEVDDRVDDRRVEHLRRRTRRTARRRARRSSRRRRALSGSWMGLVVAREAVSRDVVPRRPRGDEVVELRADAGVAVERPEADRDLFALRPLGAEQARAADRAEGLHPAVARPEDADQLLTGKQAEPRARDASLRSAEGARVLAAPRAVAVIGPRGRAPSPRSERHRRGMSRAGGSPGSARSRRKPTERKRSGWRRCACTGRSRRRDRR